MVGGVSANTSQYNYNQQTRIGNNIANQPSARTTSNERVIYAGAVPEDIGVLMTPQDWKTLQEQGSMRVRQTTSEMESNEGIFTIAAKFAACFVGPSRSIGALSIDPMFMEMIKDPNAEVGFGYTRVKSSTLQVIPSPKADPVPPEVKPPAPKPVLQTVDPYEITRKKRDEVDAELDDIPTTPVPPTEPPPAVIDPLPQTVGLVSVSSMQDWLGTAQGNLNRTWRDTTQIGGMQEIAGSTAKGPVYQYSQALVSKQFTGDVASVNLFNAEQQQLTFRRDSSGNTTGPGTAGGKDHHRWVATRMDGVVSTTIKDKDKGQQTGTDTYHFMTLADVKKIPLSEQGVQRYAQLTNQSVADVKAKQPPYTEADLFVAITERSTLGQPQDGQSAIPGAEVSLNNSLNGGTGRPGMLDTARAYASKVFPGQTINVESLSLQEYKALQVMADYGIKAPEANQLLSVGANGEVTLNNTDAALNVLRKTDLREAIPEGAHAPGFSVNELMANMIYTGAANFGQTAGTGFVLSLNDTQEAFNNTVGKKTPQQLGMTQEQYDALRIDRTDAAQTTGNIFSAVETIESEGAGYRSQNGVQTNMKDGQTSMSGVATAQTVASTQTAMDIPAETATVRGLPAGDEKQKKQSVLGDFTQLREMTRHSHFSPEYNRGNIDKKFVEAQNKINELKASGVDVTAYQGELDRIRDLDRAKRGQLIQMGGGDASPQAVTTVANNIGRLNVPGLVSGDADPDKAKFGTVDDQVRSVLAANPEAANTVINPQIMIEDRDAQGQPVKGEDGQTKMRPATLGDWFGKPGNPNQLRDQVYATATKPLAPTTTTVAANAPDTVIGNIGKINKPEIKNENVEAYLNKIDTDVAAVLEANPNAGQLEIKPQIMVKDPVSGANRPARLSDWGTKDEPGPLREAVKATAMQTPVDVSGPLTNDESASRVAGNLSRLEAIGTNDAIAPGTTQKISDHIKADIDKLSALPPETPLTITNPDGSQTSTTAGQLVQRYQAAVEIGTLAEVRSAGAVTDGIAQTRDMAKDFKSYVKGILADGKISTDEKKGLQDTIDRMTMDLGKQLAGKVKDFPTPEQLAGMNPTQVAAALKTLPPESIQEANLPEGVLNAIEEVNACQACLNVAQEGSLTSSMYQSVQKLNQRLDEFHAVGVAKTAFRGEMQKYANENPPAAFNTIIKTAYGINPDSPAAETLRNQAKNGTLPFPPNVRFVDRAQLGGANGGYVGSIQDTNGRDKGPAILLSRDLMSNPDLLRDVFTEEMFHHLERQDPVQQGLGNTDPDGPKIDAQGDEGRAGLYAMRQARTVNRSEADISAAGEKGKLEEANVGGLVDKSPKGIVDQGQLRESQTAGVKMGFDDFVIPKDTPIEFNSSPVPGTIVRGKDERRTDEELAAIASTLPTYRSADGFKPEGTYVEDREGVEGYNKYPNVTTPIQNLNPQELAERQTELPAQLKYANDMFNNVAAQLNALPNFPKINPVDRDNATSLDFQAMLQAVDQYASDPKNVDAFIQSQPELKAAFDTNPAGARALAKQMLSDMKTAITEAQKSAARMYDNPRGVDEGTTMAQNYGSDNPATTPGGGTPQSMTTDPEKPSWKETISKVMQPLGRGLQQLGAQLMNIMDAQLEKVKQLWYGPGGVLSNLQSSILAHDVIYGKGGGHGYDADVAVGREDQRDGKDRNHIQRASASFSGTKPDYEGAAKAAQDRADEYRTNLFGANQEILQRKNAKKNMNAGSELA